jgi:hypothetical protein
MSNEIPVRGGREVASDEFLRVYCSAFASPVASRLLWICNFKRLMSVSRVSRDEYANARPWKPD